MIMRPTTAEHETETSTRFLFDMLTVEAWQAFADMGHVPPEQVLAQMPPDVRTDVSDPRVRLHVQEWARRYALPLDTLVEFRNGFVHGAPTSHEELGQVREAAQVALNALYRRLGRIDQLAS
jgi:hypothetical protein